MKQVFALSLALCSIVLMAAFTTPQPPSNDYNLKSSDVVVKVDLTGTQTQNYVFSNLTLNHGTLPERINVPAPSVKMINNKEKDEKREQKPLLKGSLLKHVNEPVPKLRI